MRRLRARDDLTDGHAAYVAWVALGPGRMPPLHDHDFPELFLAERGAVAHRTRAGTERLEAGALVLLRPEDAHGLTGAPDGTILNLMLAAPALAELAARYALAGRGGTALRAAPPCSAPARRRRG